MSITITCGVWTKRSKWFVVNRVYGLSCKMYTISESKIVLSSYKWYVVPYSTETLPWEHWWISLQYIYIYIYIYILYIYVYIYIYIHICVYQYLYYYYVFYIFYTFTVYMYYYYYFMYYYYFLIIILIYTSCMFFYIFI